MIVDLKGKSALVTGGASGIGRATVELMAELGARILVCDRDLAGAQKVAAAFGDAVAFEADVSSPEDCDAMVQAAVDAFGRLDVAVNNAGVSPQRALLHEVTTEDYRRVMGINCDGMFYGMRAEVRAMLGTGGGAIVNTTSVSAITAPSTMTAYVAAKHAALGLTRACAMDYARSGIRANAVGPAFTITGMTTVPPEQREAFALEASAIGRAAQPGEVATLICFLASDAASFCTGGWYPVDGGETAH
jgi:NAD(P)-dependent dehydrogenase (short-subunit alcohol dehydrogenase family)